MQIINYMSHWRRKTFIFYLVITVTYLVLLLGEEADGKTDWKMLGQLFTNGIVGVAIQSWWLMSYQSAIMSFDREMMHQMQNDK